MYKECEIKRKRKTGDLFKIFKIFFMYDILDIVCNTMQYYIDDRWLRQQNWRI